MSEDEFARIKAMLTEIVGASVTAAMNEEVHQTIMPVLAAVADQTAEVLQSQRQTALDIKELFGRLTTLEARFDKLVTEHRRCPHCSGHIQ